MRNYRLKRHEISFMHSGKISNGYLNCGMSEQVEYFPNGIIKNLTFFGQHQGDRHFFLKGYFGKTQFVGQAVWAHDSYLNGVFSSTHYLDNSSPLKFYVHGESKDVFIKVFLEVMEENRLKSIRYLERLKKNQEKNTEKKQLKGKFFARNKKQTQIIGHYHKARKKLEETLNWREK